MPELPEVQTTVNGINEVAKNWRIVDVWTDYNSPSYASKREIKNPAYFEFFKKEITDCKIINTQRRGKNILIHLSPNKEQKYKIQEREIIKTYQQENNRERVQFKKTNKHNTILIHMKMTGHIMSGEYIHNPSNKTQPWKAKDLSLDNPLNDPFNRFIHLVFTLQKDKEIKHLVMSDMRKFGKVTLIDTENIYTSLDLSHIGPEPLDEKFNFSTFRSMLKKKERLPIKQVLMDQSLIAGIGNIYSDEILWKSEVHPLSVFNKIPEYTQRLMFDATKEILLKGIDFGGDSMSDYRNINGVRGNFQGEHKAYRKTKEICSKNSCTGIISRKVIGGRSSHFCNIHQILF